jgi:K+-dependent Na+/Ca+ exchanger-like protein
LIVLGAIVALIISFYLLAEISDRYFVVSLDRISDKLGMSHDMAGATLMAIGSSAPELFVAIIAIFKPGGHAEIGIGTIVGSALFNLLVIVGAVGIVKKSTLAWQPVVRDLGFYVLSIAILFYVLINGSVSIWEAASFLVLYAVYIFAVVNWKKWFGYVALDEDPEEEEDEPKQGWMKIFMPFDWLLSVIFPRPKYYFIIFFISIAFIAALCWILVESAIIISAALEIPELVIAMTVLAVGTSVPDMMSSVIVAKQGRGGMAVSNGIGSNIFDILIGLGLPWMIKAYLVDSGIVINIDDLNRSILILFVSVLFMLFVLMFRKWRLGQGIGLLFILIYIAYVLYEIGALYFEF